MTSTDSSVSRRELVRVVLLQILPESSFMHRRNVLRGVGTALLPIVSGCSTSETTDEETVTTAEKARAFVGDMAAGKFNRAHNQLNNTLQQRFDVSLLERLWAGLEAQHGAYNKVTETEPMTIDDVAGVSVDVDCAVGTARFGFATDGQSIVKFDNLAKYSPPEYADQSAFSERTVEVGPQSLPGTVSVPDDGNSVPGVVLVHGSGSVDRNATLGTNKPFQDLAWGLASRGIAVLRYDKRTFVQDVPPADQTLETVTVTDAVAAINRLADVPTVDRHQRIVVGHSLGAMATPRLLNRTDAVAGVMLAAHARPITEVAADQVRHRHSVIDGTLSSQDRQEIKELEQTFQKVKNGDIPDEEVVFGVPAVWWRSLLSYDQVATARGLSVPLWIGQGGRDYQVLSEEDFQQWQTALSDKSSATFSLYEQLSHLLSPGKGSSLVTEYEYHDNVSVQLVTDLASWISTVKGQ